MQTTKSSLKLQFIDQTMMQLVCDRGLLKEIAERFTFYVKGYKFMPSFKKGFWDGKIRLVNLNTATCYVGLVYNIIEFCKEQDYSLYIDDDLKISLKGEEIDTEEFCSSLNLPQNKQPRYYQHDTLEISSKFKRGLIVSPTGSGKSLSIYIIIRKILQDNPQAKILLVVPTVGLVMQMLSDFKEYSAETWDVESHCYGVYAGQEKLRDLSVCVSTYQSIYQLPDAFFARYDTLINDEVHLAQAKSLKSIVERCVNAKNRLGFTGTLDESATNETTLTGMFGRVYKVASTAELMDSGHLANLQIEAHIIKYPDAVRQNVSAQLYQDEIMFLVEHKERQQYIADFALNLSGNVLILATQIEHCQMIYDMIKKKSDVREVFFVSGDTKAKERERIRHTIQASDSSITVATYGVMSTGSNIPRLNHAIFASPYKSKIKVLQSIGRILRKDIDKNSAKLYDIVDDFSWKRRMNHSMKHFMNRCRLYSLEGFELTMKEVKL